MTLEKIRKFPQQCRTLIDRSEQASLDMHEPSHSGIGDDTAAIARPELVKFAFRGQVAVVSLSVFKSQLFQAGEHFTRLRRLECGCGGVIQND